MSTSYDVQTDGIIQSRIAEAVAEPDVIALVLKCKRIACFGALRHGEML
jgi:hypothetical protein